MRHLVVVLGGGTAYLIHAHHSRGTHYLCPEASMLARVIAYGAWRREVMFMHFIRLNSSLLSKKICSVLDVKSRLSRQRILSQLETAAQCLTYSMCQFEAPGGSSLLKLLVTDLWTLLWTILLMRLTRLSSPLLSKKICSVLNVKSEVSPFTSTHLEPIRDDGAVFNPYDV